MSTDRPSLREALYALTSALADAVGYTGGDQAPDIRTSDLLPLLADAKSALAAHPPQEPAAAPKAPALLDEADARRLDWLEGERIRFEKWMRATNQAHLLEITAPRPDSSWEYLSAGTQHKWKGWSARASMDQPHSGETPT